MIHPFRARVALLLVVFATLLAGGATTAHAVGTGGSYDVYACGNGYGNQSWQDAGFVYASNLTCTPNGTVPSHLSSDWRGLQARTSVGTGEVVEELQGWGQRIVAPSGVTITRMRATVGMQTRGVEYTGWRAGIYSDVGDGDATGDWMVQGDWGAINLYGGLGTVGPMNINGNWSTLTLTPVLPGATQLVQSVFCVQDGGNCTTNANPGSQVISKDIITTLYDGSAPSISAQGGSLWSPATYLTGSKTLSFSASDTSGIAQLRAYVEGTYGAGDWIPVGETPLDEGCNYGLVAPCPSSKSLPVNVDTNQFTDGAHRIKLEAVNAGGTIGASYGETYIDHNAPTVTRIGGTLGSSVTHHGQKVIDMRVADSGSGVYRVQLLVDGDLVQDFTPPGGTAQCVAISGFVPTPGDPAISTCLASGITQLSLNTKNLTNGTHTITVRVLDGANHVATHVQNVSVAVQNDDIAEPRIYGDPELIGLTERGKEVRVVGVQYDGDPGTVTYQWRAEGGPVGYSANDTLSTGNYGQSSLRTCANDGQVVQSGTSPVYTPVAGDVGCSLSVLVTVTNGAGSDSWDSAPRYGWASGHRGTYLGDGWPYRTRYHAPGTLVTADDAGDDLLLAGPPSTAATFGTQNPQVWRGGPEDDSYNDELCANYYNVFPSGQHPLAGRTLHYVPGYALGSGVLTYEMGLQRRLSGGAWQDIDGTERSSFDPFDFSEQYTNSEFNAYAYQVPEADIGYHLRVKQVLTNDEGSTTLYSCELPPVVPPIEFTPLEIGDQHLLRDSISIEQQSTVSGGVPTPEGYNGPPEVRYRWSIVNPDLTDPVTLAEGTPDASPEILESPITSDAFGKRICLTALYTDIQGNEADTGIEAARCSDVVGWAAATFSQPMSFDITYRDNDPWPYTDAHYMTLSGGLPDIGLGWYPGGFDGDPGEGYYSRIDSSIHRTVYLANADFSSATTLSSASYGSSMPTVALDRLYIGKRICVRYSANEQIRLNVSETFISSHSSVNGGIGPDSCSAPLTADLYWDDTTVAIPSAANIGSQVTATLGAWSGANLLTYDWEYSTDFGGSWTSFSTTGSTITLPPEVTVGSFVRLRVTGHGANDRTKSVESGWLTVAENDFAFLVAPSVSGLPYPRATQTAIGEQTIGDGVLSFAWYRYHETWNAEEGVSEISDLQSIDGADQRTYVATSDDIGYRLLVVTTFTENGGDQRVVEAVNFSDPSTIWQASSAQIQAFESTNLTTPTISWAAPGTAAVDQPSTWDYDIDYPGVFGAITRQWQADYGAGFVDVDGEVASTFNPDSSAQFVRVCERFSGYDGYLSDTVCSDPLEQVVEPLGLQYLTWGAINGITTVGQTLTLDPGTLSRPNEDLDFTVYWAAVKFDANGDLDFNDVRVLNGNGMQVVLTESEIGYRIFAQVFASDDDGNTATNSDLWTGYTETGLGPLSATVTANAPPETGKNVRVLNATQFSGTTLQATVKCYLPAGRVCAGTLRVGTGTRAVEEVKTTTYEVSGGETQQVQVELDAAQFATLGTMATVTLRPADRSYLVVKRVPTG